MEADNLEKELQNTRSQLNKTIIENKALTKAIWDMLNYSQIFVVMLDKNMTVRLANWYLATTLGLQNENDIVGKCWLDFIDQTEQSVIKSIHLRVSSGDNHNEYREVITNIKTLNGKKIPVRWFNIRINSGYNLTFSVGVKRDIPHEETEDSIRTYYQDIVDRDKTIIKALKQSFLEGIDNINICIPELNEK